MKPIKDFKEGSKVRYYCNSDGSLSSVSTPYSDVAEVIFNQVQLHPYVYLGWKPGDVALIGAQPVATGGTYASMGFDRYIKLHPDVLVEDALFPSNSGSVVEVAAPKLQGPDGMKCSKCRDFAHYAQANQPNGSFLCYRCRR